MTTAAQEFARYAVAVRYEDLPEPAARLARYCLFDAVACAIHGSRLPWSQVILETALASSGEGACLLPPALPRGLPPVPASYCLGAFAHAFELDCLRKPGAGVHPGATVALPALAVAQATRSSGRELIAAIVAGCEVMFRIGNATLHSSESIGFHAPGITGPFGAATAAGCLMGLSADQLANAYGICGSLAGGILNFASSREGGMVKRLHLGRAAESGVLAANLASRGFEGPSEVIEGRFGVLDAFCDRSDQSLLLDKLGERYEIEALCLKRYACHATAQTPIQILRDLMEAHGFGGEDIASLSLRVSDKVLSHHAEREPKDLMLAQYSVPFSVAVAAFRNPEDPASFSPDITKDRGILDLARRIDLVGGRAKGWGTALSVTLKDGRQFAGEADGFLGCPEAPCSDGDLRQKFLRLTDSGNRSGMEDLLSRLLAVENIGDFSGFFR